MSQTNELLILAEGLARQAGELLMAGLNRERATIETKTTSTDMVTEMDRASEALIVAGLRTSRPDDAIVGEEGTDDHGTSGVRWLIDPLDGTTNYLYRHPGFNVSIAAEVEGRAVAGVVHDPMRDETFVATAGGGARCNGVDLLLGAAPALDRALVGTGFSYSPRRRAHQAAVLTHVLPLVRDIRRGGAAAIDLCWVAIGRLDAYFERGLGPWDLAAGGLIASEAGAWVGPGEQGACRTDLTVAAGPQLAPDLLALLTAAHRHADVVEGWDGAERPVPTGPGPGG